MRGRRHMTYTERVRLEEALRHRVPVAEIARELGFARQTIYNEMERGSYMHNVAYAYEKRYSAAKGQIIHVQRQTMKGRPLKIGNDLAYANFLESKMLSKSDRRRRCSPAVALQLAKREGFETEVCVATLYSYIDKGIFLELTNKDLWEKPKRKPKKKKDDTEEPKIAHNSLPSITQRPEGSSKRSELGHWEMDLVISADNKRSCLLTMTERRSRQEIIIPLPDHKAVTVRRAINRLERKTVGFKQKFRTITTDNGPEFLEHDQLIQSVKSKGQRFQVYYCHSYSAWEKGTVEVHNRMIRRWFPKGTDFSKVSQKEIAALQDWMNSYPRKVLGWKTPAEVTESA